MKQDDSVAGLGEDRLVSGILGRLGRRRPEWLLVEPGDDAAVLALAAAEASGLVVGTDTLVQDRDFRLSSFSGADVGVKVAAQNFADLAAMGARPLALLVSLAVPGATPTSWVDGLAEGLELECDRAGAAVVGGDVSDAAEIVVTGTALGSMDGRAPVRRSGARPGDVLAMAGVTGPAAAGLALLEAGLLEAGLLEAGLGGLVRAQRRPQPDYAAGVAAARAGATAMIDTSDGLVRDALRVARASGVLIDLDPAALAPGPDLLAAAARLGDESSASAWLLTGGEDHALLAAFPAGTALPPSFRPVGRVLEPVHEVPPDDATPLTVAGRPWSAPTGWTHFS